MVGIANRSDSKVKTFSQGMKQRLGLAIAMVHDPDLLVLDEPTNGLDPAGRVDMLELIRSVTHGKGVNAIVSSHLLPDIERVCDHVVVLVGGRLRAMGRIQDLKQLEAQAVDVELRENSPAFEQAMLEAGGRVVGRERFRYRIAIAGIPEEVARIVFEAARRSGSQVRGFEVAERSLEEAFLEAVRG